ncbi:MAG: ArsR/SmtB family transcription factor [Halorubrum sp.]
MSRLLPSLPDATPDDREPRVVGVDDEDADDLIAALGSETAREIITRLHDEPATKSELAADVDTSLQNVQYHLSKLDGADLVDVVDTTYSEKGREMDVYAAADEPLVLFAGGTEESHGIKTALMRLLGGYGLIGLAALAAQRVLSVAAPTGYQVTRHSGDGGTAGDDAETEDAADGDGGGGDGAGGGETTDGPSIETSPDADGGGSEIDGTVEYVVDPLADYAVSLLEPGVVFFLGAALVFTVVWAYWYWEMGR